MTAPRKTGRHIAGRIEDDVLGVVRAVLGRRGWRPRVLAHTGYGAQGWVRVFARVVLSPPRAGDRGARPQPDPQRGWRLFLTLPVEGAAVTVDVAGVTHVLRSDRGGYVDARIPASLTPGWHTLSLRVGSGPAASCRVRVASPDAEVGLVSDIDDTVMVTLLPRPLLAAWNTFVLREHARRPVEGMARLLGALPAAQPEAMVIYLSTGAWNVAPTLHRFLARHGYPPGPLLLTDWGPTPTGWFRSGQAHKAAALRRLAEEFPGVRWLLVGDDGQHDPQIYREFARTDPEAVLAVAIRQLTPTELVLAHGRPLPSVGADGRATAEELPWLTGPDGHVLLSDLTAAGVLTPVPR